MPPPRKYDSGAERQAAHRARNMHNQPPRQTDLAFQARQLHCRLQQAVEDGQSVLPDKLLGANPVETLGNIGRFIEWNTDRGRRDYMLQKLANLNPDEPFAAEPVRYPK